MGTRNQSKRAFAVFEVLHIDVQLSLCIDVCSSFMFLLTNVDTIIVIGSVKNMLQCIVKTEPVYVDKSAYRIKIYFLASGMLCSYQ